MANEAPKGNVCEDATETLALNLLARGLGRVWGPPPAIKDAAAGKIFPSPPTGGRAAPIWLRVAGGTRLGGKPWDYHRRGEGRRPLFAGKSPENWVHQDDRLIPQAKNLITEHETRRIGFSAISCWEVAELVERGRLRLPMAVDQWHHAADPGTHRRIPLDPQTLPEEGDHGNQGDADSGQDPLILATLDSVRPLPVIYRRDVTRTHWPGYPLLKRTT